MRSVHELFKEVREHPDFVFGTIFVKEDFPGGEPRWLPTGGQDWAEDHLVAAGNTFIENENEGGALTADDF